MGFFRFRAWNKSDGPIKVWWSNALWANLIEAFYINKMRKNVINVSPICRK